MEGIGLQLVLVRSILELWVHFYGHIGYSTKRALAGLGIPRSLLAFFCPYRCRYDVNSGQSSTKR